MTPWASTGRSSISSQKSSRKYDNFVVILGGWRPCGLSGSRSHFQSKSNCLLQVHGVAPPERFFRSFPEGSPSLLHLREHRFQQSRKRHPCFFSKGCYSAEQTKCNISLFCLQCNGGEAAHCHYDSKAIAELIEDDDAFFRCGLSGACISTTHFRKTSDLKRIPEISSIAEHLPEGYAFFDILTDFRHLALKGEDQGRRNKDQAIPDGSRISRLIARLSSTCGRAAVVTP